MTPCALHSCVLLSRRLLLNVPFGLSLDGPTRRGKVCPPLRRSTSMHHSKLLQPVGASDVAELRPLALAGSDRHGSTHTIVAFKELGIICVARGSLVHQCGQGTRREWMESTREVRAKFNARAQHMRDTAKAGATPLEQFLTDATAPDVEDGPWQLSFLNGPLCVHSDVVRRFMEHSTCQKASYQWQNIFEK